MITRWTKNEERIRREKGKNELLKRIMDETISVVHSEEEEIDGGKIVAFQMDEKRRKGKKPNN